MDIFYEGFSMNIHIKAFLIFLGMVIGNAALVGILFLASSITYGDEIILSIIFLGFVYVIAYGISNGLNL